MTGFILSKKKTKTKKNFLFHSSPRPVDTLECVKLVPLPFNSIELDSKASGSLCSIISSLIESFAWHLMLIDTS